MQHNIFIILLLSITLPIFSQPVPGLDENIPHLITFGKNGDTAWGDSDFCQIIYYSIPQSHSQPIFIRVYDPEIGGVLDEQKGEWNTRMKYSIYGGPNSCSEPDAQKINLNGNYKSGTLIYTKSFAVNDRYEKSWYTFGPINPTEGELLTDYGGYTFKIIIEGISGDDGNLYNLFLSSQPNENQPVEGAFAFYFKYKFRLYDDNKEVSHIYPFIDEKVLAIKQTNFDWDNDGIIRIISVAKNGEWMKVSGDNNWAKSTHEIHPSEKSTSYDIQIIKNKKVQIKNNNVVMYLENQYGELMPFYSVPIGGVPKYKYSIGIRP